MIDLGPHAAYIIASFAVTGLILGWMIIGSVLALSGARQRLARLEKGRDR